MSIVNDKSINLQSFQKISQKKPHKVRQRSESTCQLLCFKKCDEPPAPVPQTHYLPNLKINKLSLKRMGEQDRDRDNQYRPFTKSISDKNLNLNPNMNINKFKSQTSRSQNQMKQMMLFKKKARLQNQIERVDEEMSRLTLKYQKNITELRAIKRQLQFLKYS